MPDESAFLRAIIESPDDDGPRLVFADWLDERGDHDRAEFIRLQCELARLPEWDPGRARLEPRERELLAAHEAEWAEAGLLPGNSSDWVFRRGFLDEIVFDSETLLDWAGGVFDRHPIRRVRIAAAYHTVWPNTIGERLADEPLLARISALEVRAAHLGADGAAALADSPFLSNLLSLDLSDNNIGPSGALALSRSRSLGRLRTLWLNGFAPTTSPNPILDEGVRYLADAPGLPNLSELWVGQNGLTAEAVRWLAEGPRFDRWVSLGLASNRLAADGLRRLSQARLSSLRELDLAATSTVGDGLARLVASPRLSDLERLDLGGNLLSRASAQSLAAGPLASRLTHLDLGNCRPAELAIRTLMNQWPTNSRLTDLDLSDDRLDDPDAQAIANALGLARLRRLNLSYNRITDAGARALAESPYLTGLTSLELHGNPISRLDK